MADGVEKSNLPKRGGILPSYFILYSDVESIVQCFFLPHSPALPANSPEQCPRRGLQKFVSCTLFGPNNSAVVGSCPERTFCAGAGKVRFFLPFTSAIADWS